MLLVEGKVRRAFEKTKVATQIVQKVGFLIILADGLFLKLEDTGRRHEHLELKTDVSLDKPDNGVATSFQKVGLILSAGGLFL